MLLGDTALPELQSTFWSGFVQRIRALPLATGTSTLPGAISTPVPLSSAPLPKVGASTAPLSGAAEPVRCPGSSLGRAI